MAFIRSKEVRGHKYYQAVRNYRDSNGKHRQEVLCHLGVNGSLDAAIDAERKKITFHRERASAQRAFANDLRADTLERHGWEFVDGELPSEAEAAQELDPLWDQWEAYYDHNHPYHRAWRRQIDIEDVDIQVEKYLSCIEYYAAMRRASWADHRAEAHQEKLDKLLQVKHEYF